MFHLLWSVIVGFVIGLIARALLPGADSMGMLMTTGVGIVGSLIGGGVGVGGMIKKREPAAKFHPAGFALSVVGAVVRCWCCG